MNAALQCLSSIQPLTEYFLSNVHEDEQNPKFNGEVSTAYSELMRAQWQNDYESIQPVYLCTLMWEIAPQFDAGHQHDSQEFLAYVLDSLHEELNRCTEDGCMKITENPGEQDEKQAADAWNESLFYNSSVIVDLFQGQLRSTLTCLHCRYISTSFDTYTYLTLPLPRGESCTLEDCLKEFTKEETLIKQNRWTCHNCKHRTRAKKKIDIWTFPPVLIVHLKRFQFFKTNPSKISKFVQFPVEELDLSVLDIGPHKFTPKYSLFAKIDHIGSSNTGHYIAQARNFMDQKWYLFDDEIVEEISENSLVNSNAYVLFYHNASVNSFPTQSALLPQLWPHCINSYVPTKDSEGDNNIHALQSTALSFGSWLNP